MQGKFRVFAMACVFALLGLPGMAVAQSAHELAQQFDSPTLALSDHQGLPYYPQDAQIFAGGFIDRRSLVIAAPESQDHVPRRATPPAGQVTRSQVVRSDAFPTQPRHPTPNAALRAITQTSSNIMDPWTVGVFR